jgi:fatty acid desaturase
MDASLAPGSLIGKKRLKALSERSDTRGLRQLASHLVALGATGAVIALSKGSYWLAPALVLHGLVLVFLFAPLHETIHRTAFRNRVLNDVVAWFCGLLLVLPPAYFRAFHFAHHRHTQDPARDPELAQAKPHTLGAYLRVVSGLPYWRERIATTFSHAAGRVREPFVPAAGRVRVIREARIVLGIYGAIAAVSFAAGSWLALVYWVVPALLGQPFLRLFLLAEHTGCPAVPDMLRNSRTTLSNALVRRLAWNMPYHAEHHAYPALPFHALPAAHALLEDKIAVRSPGYLAVQRQIVAGLRGWASRRKARPS